MEFSQFTQVDFYENAINSTSNKFLSAPETLIRIQTNDYGVGAFTGTQVTHPVDEERGFSGLIADTL